jgi:hypothetical protein
MKSRCPSCGAPCETDGDVVSLVNVWMNCGRCRWVWRSSLLGSALHFVTRTVGFRPALRKTLDVLPSEYPAQGSPEPLLSDAGHAGDLDGLERALNAVTSRAAFAPDAHDQVDVEVAGWPIGEELRPAASRASNVSPGYSSDENVEEQFSRLDAASVKHLRIPVWEDVDADDAPVEEAIHAEPPSDASLDRTLESLQGLCGRFERLKHQLEGMGRSCEEMTRQ